MKKSMEIKVWYFIKWERIKDEGIILNTERRILKKPIMYMGEYVKEIIDYIYVYDIEDKQCITIVLTKDYITYNKFYK